MTSPRQLQANRQNALRSTGPRSDAGKARSRLNALRHGLTAQHVVLPGESPKEFEKFRRSAFDSLRPEDELEMQLAGRLVTLLWRLRRILAIETAIYAWTAQWHGISAEDNAADIDRAARRDDIDEFTDRDEREARVAFGQVFQALFEKDFIGKLSRYEMSLQKQFTMTLHQFRDLRRNRLDPRNDGAIPEVMPARKLLRKREVQRKLPSTRKNVGVA
jgi:hypothetical protein